MVTTLALLAVLLDTEPINLATPDSWTGSMQGGTFLILFGILIWAVISIENSRNRNKKDE